MGFFFSDEPRYQVVKELGWLSGGDKVVLENATLSEAQRYVDRHTGFFGGDGHTYRIVRMWE